MIPVFEPRIGEEEIEAVTAALRRGEISGTFGQALTDFENQFAAYCGVRHGVAVTSGTTALHLAVAVAGIGRGDEVLVSASTNIASALGVHHNGALTIPVDVEAETWNLNLDLVESLITSKTKAIIPVHLYGHPVDMDRLMGIARAHHVLVIEDAAQAHGAQCRGRRVGSFGDMACFSFYANKIITTGEGGMVVTDNDELADQLRYLRNLAFGRPRFLHHQAGYNFRMTSYQAAMGLVQLKKIDQIIREKRRIAAAYANYLGDLTWLQLPIEQAWATNVYWMYAIKVKPERGLHRDDITRHLFDLGIDTRTFFCPLNQQPCLKAHEDWRDVACPIADELWETGLYLPSSISLTDQHIEEISKAVVLAGERAGALAPRAAV